MPIVFFCSDVIYSCSGAPVLTHQPLVFTRFTVLIILHHGRVSVKHDRSTPPFIFAFRAFQLIANVLLPLVFGISVKLFTLIS
jgi:hypothetical protein